MEDKDVMLVVVCMISIFCDFARSKTITGTLTTAAAQREKGQFLTTFGFHGNAVIQYTVNTTGDNPAKLYLFLSEDWKDTLDDGNCDRKLDKARLVFEILNTTGNQTVPHFTSPRIWQLVYADQFTCASNRPVQPLDKPNYIHYEIELLNPDALDNPINHFSDEESGLLRFYQLLTLAYFVLSCIFAPRLHETFSKGGPMQLVIQLLTASNCLQAFGAFLMMVHLQWYSKDGVGSPFCELVSELCDVLSQFAVLYMLLSLSLGWALGTAHRHSHLRMISQKPAAKVVGAIGLIQGVLFLWEQYGDRNHQMYHAHRSYGGVALIVLRILLAALFAWNLYVTVSAERSKLKREFFMSFTKSCMLWFLCYPVIIFSSWLFSEYLRYKMLTMGVVLCQCVAVVLLYRLFLSRSLYWEVSALSNTLPIRFNSKLGLKIYS